MSGSHSEFDWVGMMRAGLYRLRLPPEEFWRLTPAELRTMLGSGSEASALGRSGLERLLRAFPDETQGEPDGGA